MSGDVRSPVIEDGYDYWGADPKSDERRPPDEARDTGAFDAAAPAREAEQRFRNEAFNEGSIARPGIYRVTADRSGVLRAVEIVDVDCKCQCTPNYRRTDADRICDPNDAFRRGGSRRGGGGVEAGVIVDECGRVTGRIILNPDVLGGRGRYDDRCDDRIRLPRFPRCDDDRIRLPRVPRCDDDRICLPRVPRCDDRLPVPRYGRGSGVGVRVDRDGDVRIDADIDLGRGRRIGGGVSLPGDRHPTYDDWCGTPDIGPVFGGGVYGRGGRGGSRGGNRGGFSVGGVFDGGAFDVGASWGGGRGGRDDCDDRGRRNDRRDDCDDRGGRRNDWDNRGTRRNDRNDCDDRGRYGGGDHRESQRERDQRRRDERDDARDFQRDRLNRRRNDRDECRDDQRQRLDRRRNEHSRSRRCP